MSGAERFGRLIPFNWEIICFSLGALFMGISEKLAVAAVGIALFGGLLGHLAFQRALRQEVEQDV